MFGGAASEEIDEAANMKDSEALPVAGVATVTGSEDSEGILPVPVPLAIAVPVPVVVVAAEIVAGATASVVATLPVALAAVAGV